MSAPAVDGCTVVIVNYNGGEFLADCLLSVCRQNVTGARPDIVVVDNASTDGSAEMVDQFPGVTLIRSATNLGFGGAVNLGMAHTTGDLVVLLNPDARADPDFLERITAPFRQHDGGDGAGHSGDGARLAAVTARILLDGRFVPAPDDPDAYVSADGQRWARLPATASADAGVSLLNSTGSQLSRSGNGRDRSWLSPADTVEPAEVFGFCGGACALRRSAVTAVGGFDERLFLYYEDTDLSWRLRRHGWAVRYAADAVVHHRHSASSGIHSAVFLRHNIRNRVLVVARNGPAIMLGSAVLHTGGHLLRMVRSRFSRGGRARTDTEWSASWWAIGRLAVMLPGYLAQGRRLDRAATLPRDFVTGWTLQDGAR